MMNAATPQRRNAATPQRRNQFFSVGQCAGIAILIVFLAAGCGEQSTSGLGARASIAEVEAPKVTVPVVCREPGWDFGTLDQTKTHQVTHTFRLENVSDRLVRIAKIEPACGCIISKDSPTELAARTNADVNLTVNLAGPPGPFLKFVSIRLLADPPEVLKLTIQGMVTAPSAFYFAPTILDFGNLSENETKTRTVKIARYDGSAMRFDHAMFDSPALSQVKAVSGDAADSFVELCVSLDGSQLNPGDFQSRIVAVTAHSSHREAMIPIKATISGSQHGLVSSIFCQLSPGDSRDLPLVGGVEFALTVESVRIEEGVPIRVELLPVTDDRQAPMIRVSRSEETSGPRVLRGDLVVTLAGRAKPIRIPLRAFLTDQTKL